MQKVNISGHNMLLKEKVHLFFIKWWIQIWPSVY